MARGWRVTLPPAVRFLSTKRQLIEPKSWAILARGWRVTAPKRRPRKRAIRAAIPGTSAARVARDNPARAAAGGAPAGAIAHRPDAAAEPCVGGVERACDAEKRGTPCYRLAAPASPKPLAGTTCDTPCTVSLLGPCRPASRPTPSPSQFLAPITPPTSPDPGPGGLGGIGAQSGRC